MTQSNGTHDSKRLKTSIEEKNGITNNSNKILKKKWIINAFDMACSGHQSPGLWKHPKDQSTKYKDIDYWTNVAKLLEKGKIHGIFIADVIGGYDVYKKSLVPSITSGAQWPINDPTAYISAMSAVTKSLSFGITISTAYEYPYHLARRLSTLDHITKGRLGWNIVTSYLDSAARNMFNGENQKPHEERYEQAKEFTEVNLKLWESSWRDDAVILNRKSGVYTDPNLVRQINHKGKFYTVPGPHICEPSPQRTPVLLQAGTSKSGKNFAAKFAEGVFVASYSYIQLSKTVADIRSLAKELNRDPNSIKILALVTPVLGKTDAEAQEKFNSYASYGDLEGALALFGGWTGVDLSEYKDDEELRYVESNSIRSAIESWAKVQPGVKRWTKLEVARHVSIGGLGPTIVGSPKTVADQLEKWISEADLDGFNMAYAITPGSFEDIIDLLIPELQSRGLFHTDYEVPSGTYRENLLGVKGQTNLRDDHPYSSYRWKTGVSREDFEASLEKLQ